MKVMIIINCLPCMQITSLSGADLAQRVANKYQQLQQNMADSASSLVDQWTNADGTFKPGAYMKQLASKIAAGWCCL